MIHRRSLIAVAAAVPVAGLAGSFVPAAPVDPHAGWLAQWRQARKDWWKASLADPSGDSSAPECAAAQDREYEARDRIIGTKAQTREGFEAQVKFLLEDASDDLKFEYGEVFLDSIQEYIG